jgi:uncharacterized protein YhaN
VELDRNLDHARIRLEALLGKDAVEDVEQQRVTAVSVVADIERAYPTWHENPPDVSALQTNAEQLTLKYRAAVSMAEDDWESGESLRSAAENKHAEVSARRQEVEKQIARLEQRLSALTNDGRTDAERRDELATACLAWEAAQTALADAEKDLNRFSEDPSADVERLQAQVQAAEAQGRNLLAQEKLEEGRLGNLAIEGPHSLVAIAEEELAHICVSLRREALRMQAVKLLWDTYTAAKASAIAAVAQPVEAAATRTLERVAGRRLGRIRLDGCSRPERMQPESSDGPIAVAEASGGEQEQIFFATRLALAEVIAEQERPLVILDDALTASDAGRLARAMKVLEEAAERMQILILTCHPERYGGLRNTTFIDLERAAVAAPQTA